MRRSRPAARRGLDTRATVKLLRGVHSESRRLTSARSREWRSDRGRRSGSDAPGGIRTPDFRLRRAALYPLSYWRVAAKRTARARRRSANISRMPSSETASDIFDSPATRSLKTKGTSSMRLPIR